MTKVVDRTGKRYGRLVALQIAGRDRGKLLWECVCDCGNTMTVRAESLGSGHTRSCGCLQRKRTSETNRKHGKAGTSGYASYLRAKERCTNIKDKFYHRYGGRGIEFRLPPFAEFWEAMGPSWFEGATIERIDNDGHYELGNVRWATRAEQTRNTSRVKHITHNGRTMLEADWARELGIPRATLNYRINAGWPIERALQPYRKE